MNTMNNIQVELKTWLTNLCASSPEFEQRLRTLLLQNKTLVRNINIAFKTKDIKHIQIMIKDFMIENKIFIRTCSSCNKKYFLVGKPDEKVYKRKCDQCGEPLFLSASKIYGNDNYNGSGLNVYDDDYWRDNYWNNIYY
jgi:predicted RNA-binding Zn-ribbon protein involved in translation (DUF1610 family)